MVVSAVVRIVQSGCNGNGWERWLSVAYIRVMVMVVGRDFSVVMVVGMVVV